MHAFGAVTEMFCPCLSLLGGAQTVPIYVPFRL
uniref:Uncharacterized protein n=1 Tax=Arundo donax TaxID=35708 RepID=A0A0A9EUI8_ARUDO